MERDVFALPDRPDVFRFDHRAMATIFEVMITGEGRDFAASAGLAVFEEIDRLEQELSRHRPNSDISRINNLRSGGATAVGLETFECLRLAQKVCRDTRGAFDITVGSMLQLPEEFVPASSERFGMESLELDEATTTVKVQKAGVLLDLGAIGKGYAVDRGVELLKEWGVGSALIHGGTSSVFAYGELNGKAGWPVSVPGVVEGGGNAGQILLHDFAVSGSGIRKGRHIVDPRTGKRVDRRAAWVAVGSAAESDAISTACMVMSREEIRRYASEHTDAWIVIVDDVAGETVRFSYGRVPGGQLS